MSIPNRYRLDGGDPVQAMVEWPKGATFETEILHEVCFVYRTVLNSYWHLVANGGTYRFMTPLRAQ